MQVACSSQSQSDSLLKLDQALTLTVTKGDGTELSKEAVALPATLKESHRLDRDSTLTVSVSVS